jgi:hypothetical protein
MALCKDPELVHRHRALARYVSRDRYGLRALEIGLMGSVHYEPVIAVP